MEQERAEYIDEQCFKFLSENGYKVEKSYTKEKAEAIFEQIAKDGKKLVYVCWPWQEPEFCLVDKRRFFKGDKDESKR